MWLRVLGMRVRACACVGEQGGTSAESEDPPREHLGLACSLALTPALARRWWDVRAYPTTGTEPPSGSHGVRTHTDAFLWPCGKARELSGCYRKLHF